MKARIFSLFVLVVSLALLLALLPEGTELTRAQGRQPPTFDTQEQRGPPEPTCGLEGPHDAWQKSLSGQWFMAEGARPSVGAAGVVPQASGGPDDFGYTWDDSVPLNWIDASGGTDTGINSSTDHVGPVSIGFPFKYYENTYTQLYISRFGFVAFNDDNIYDTQSRIPNPEKPNDVIAPHWVPAHGVNGYVRYLSGGSAPNRWFVVEWNRLESACCGDDGPEEYTFEVILHENGDIVFQYGTMIVDGGYYCQASGIEDSTGLDGLSITDFCHQIEPNHAVHIYRPSPSARVKIFPLYQGRFTRAGETVAFQVPIRNTGELGSDTYDSSRWPAAVYASDGITPLTDTDGDGAVDTGPVAQRNSATVVVKVTTPGAASVGDHNTVALTARSSLDGSKSKTVSLQTGVPAPFAQVYLDDADGAMSLYLALPQGQQVQKVTPDWYYGHSVAVAEMPSSFAYFWSRYRRNDSVRVSEIEYTLLDRYGKTVRAVSKLADLSGATIYIYDYSPVVAVAPNGRIGVAWYRYLYNPSNSYWNDNIYYAILDATGKIIVPPTNLTKNTVWGHG